MDAPCISVTDTVLVFYHSTFWIETVSFELFPYCIFAVSIVQAASIPVRSHFDPNKISKRLLRNSANASMSIYICLSKVIACLFIKSRLTKSNNQELNSHSTKSDLA